MLNKEINAAVADATIRKRLVDLGATPLPPMSPAEFAKYDRRRHREMGQGDQGRRHEAGVIRTGAMGDIRTVVDWLTDGARSGSLPEDVLEELCRRMVDAGIPLWRAAVFVNTLHPDVMGRAFFWQADNGMQVAGGPLRPPGNRGISQQPGHRRLQPRASRSGAGSPTAIAPTTFPSCRSCGTKARRTTWRFRCSFTDGTDPRRDLVDPAARRLHAAAVRRSRGGDRAADAGRRKSARCGGPPPTCSTPMSGGRPASASSPGKIRRGHVEAIRAAIWLSDMRGFTRADRAAAAAGAGRPAQPLFRLPGAGDPRARRRGAEVHRRRIAGDLPARPTTATTGEVCGRALACARRRCADIDALERAGRRRAHRLRAGAACRPGDVRQYRRRQPARLHLHRSGGQSRRADREGRGAISATPSSASEAIRRAHARGEFTPLGEFDVAGFAAPQAVFALADEPQ